MPRRTVLALVLALLLTSPAAAQTVTRGSDFQNPANVPFGCDATVQMDWNGNFTLQPSGLPSCTWWGTGPASNPTDPRTGFVPTTGTITKVRIKSGPNPAPIRLVQLRSTAGCCTVVKHTEPIALQPNRVNEVTLNWLTEVVRDSVAGVSTNDVLGFSAVAGQGTLPLSDQGPQTHTPQASFTPGVFSSSTTAPAAQPGSMLGLNYRGAIGYETLLQYDFVPCPALNNVPIAPGTQTCPAQAIAPPPPGANAPPSGPVTNGTPGTSPLPGAMDVRTAIARLRDNRIALRLACLRAQECRGRLRLRTRGAGARTLANVPIRLRANQTKTVNAAISRANRRFLRRRATTPLTAVLDLGGGTKITDTLTFRR